jgi:hypothetical protein
MQKALIEFAAIIGQEEKKRKSINMRTLWNINISVLDV